MARAALVNNAEVDAERLGRTVEVADLPQGKIWLIVGDGKLTADIQAICIATPFVQHARNTYGLQDHLGEAWDCGISVGERRAAMEGEFPAYCAYLLAHELGHATTVLSNLTLTVYEDLILRYVQRASGRSGWRWDAMPHEVRYDCFGKAVSEEVFGAGVLDEELKAILDRGRSGDEPRLRKLLALEPRKDLNGLREELAAFSEPYRSELIRLWEEDRASGRIKIAAGLDSGWLWRKPAAGEY